MSYDTNNLKNNRGGATLEVSDKPATPAGLYRHPESGQEVITLYDPLYGDAQSEGFVRLGFERVGDAPEGAVKSIVEVILDEKKKDNTVTGIAARLEKLEGVAEDKKALEQKNAELEKELARYRAKDTQTVESGEEAKKAAEEQTEARGTDNSGQVADSGGVNSTETPGQTEETAAADHNAQTDSEDDSNDRGAADTASSAPASTESQVNENSTSDSAEGENK